MHTVISTPRCVPTNGTTDLDRLDHLAFSLHAETLAGHSRSTVISRVVSVPVNEMCCLLNMSFLDSIHIIDAFGMKA